MVILKVYIIGKGQTNFFYSLHFMAGTFKETYLSSFGSCDTLKHVVCKVRDDQNAAVSKRDMQCAHVYYELICY